jgi:hypothetical protein
MVLESAALKPGKSINSGLDRRCAVHLGEAYAVGRRHAEQISTPRLERERAIDGQGAQPVVAGRQGAASKNLRCPDRSVAAERAPTVDEHGRRRRKRTIDDQSAKDAGAAGVSVHTGHDQLAIDHVYAPATADGASIGAGTNVALVEDQKCKAVDGDMAALQAICITGQRCCRADGPVLVLRASAGERPVPADHVEGREALILLVGADVADVEFAIAGAAELQDVGVRADHVPGDLGSRAERQRVADRTRYKLNGGAGEDAGGVHSGRRDAARIENRGCGIAAAGFEDNWPHGAGIVNGPIE